MKVMLQAGKQFRYSGRSGAMLAWWILDTEYKAPVFGQKQSLMGAYKTENEPHYVLYAIRN